MDAQSNLGDWYQLFKDGGSAAEQTEPQETKKPANALGELLLYAAQAGAYADFIKQVMTSIDNEIRTDISRDINVPMMPSDIVNPDMPPVYQQALTFAATNRQKMVESAEKLSELTKAIDSILARVKFKE